LADREAKGRDETQTGINQRMINQRGLLQIAIEVMLPEMIGENKGVLDAAKRGSSKEIAWQKTSICTKRKKQEKM